MEEDTYREIASHQDIGSTRIQREQQGEIYQIVLRLKRPGISEVEQIAALQQIIILAVSSLLKFHIILSFCQLIYTAAFDRADIMQERGIIETASSLLVKSKNSKIKQLCGAIISLVGWLGIQNTIEIDWASVCYPLTQMLFSTNEEISNTGKNALTNLLEQSEDASLGLMQINFIDRAADTLIQIQQNQSSSKAIVKSSPVPTMNIFSILDLILIVSNGKLTISSKLIDTLNRIKNEGATNAIKQKAIMLLFGLDQQSNLEQKVDQKELKEIKQIDSINTKYEQIKSDNQYILIEQEMEDLLRCINGLQDQPEIKYSDWIAMKKDLEKQEIGSEAQQIDVRQKKIKICQKIISTFIQRKNHECLKHAIQSGIIDALLHLLMTQPLENIQISHAWAFYIFTYSTYEEIGFLFLSKNPFPALLRLFDHRDAFVVNRAVVSIFNILLAGSDTTEANSPHPYFTAMESCGGIQKLFALFQSNRSEYSKIRVSYCFGQLYRARELQMDEIKNEVISHLKLLLYDSDASTKNSAKFALKSLALDKANRAFIEKEGFKIPK